MTERITVFQEDLGWNRRRPMAAFLPLPGGVTQVFANTMLSAQDFSRLLTWTDLPVDVIQEPMTAEYIRENHPELIPHPDANPTTQSFGWALVNFAFAAVLVAVFWAVARRFM